MPTTNGGTILDPCAFIISRVEPRDIEGLVSLCADHARYERADYNPEGKAELLNSALFVEPPRLLVWKAKVDRRLVGYTSAASEFSTWSGRDFLHMDCLFVAEEYRGDGLGAALLATIVLFAREQGYGQVQWQTPEWNERARKFYRREGAAEKIKARFTLDL